MEESDKRIKATAVKKAMTHQDNLKKTHVKLLSRHYINTLILVDIHSLLGTAQKTKHNRKKQKQNTHTHTPEIKGNHCVTSRILWAIIASLYSIKQKRKNEHYFSPG